MNASARFDGARRSLLRAGVALAAPPVAGCASLLRERMPDFEASRPLPALSAPAIGTARPSVPNIDAHAHFFNARDVQVRGMIEGPIAHTMPDERLARLVRALGRTAQLLSYLAPSPAAEMRLLRETSAGHAALSDAKAIAQFDRDLVARREERLRALHRQLNQNDEFRTLYREIRGGALLKPVDGISLDELRAAAYRGSGFADVPIERFTPRGTAGDVRAALSVDGVLRFVVHMLSPRADNLRSYLKAYRAGSPDVPLAAAAGAMVDFDHWLGKPCNASAMDEQVRLHEQLVRLSGGFLLPFVGYNPASDLLEDGASLRVVEEAITRHGCVGVKIYPPNGFLPYGNGAGACPLPKDQPPWFDGTALDRRLARLYELCDSLGVPVMAHANRSMGEDLAHDALAGACGWGALADARAVGITALHVDAGHLGGDGADASTWTADFVALMGRATRLRLYGDLGFWDRLGAGRAAVQRLLDALRASLPGAEHGVDRVMYGSDWLMMSRVDGYERFPETVLGVLQAEGISREDIGKIFGRNALACFGLRKSDRNFARFVAHFGPELMARAAWAG